MTRKDIDSLLWVYAVLIAFILLGFPKTITSLIVTAILFAAALLAAHVFAPRFIKMASYIALVKNGPFDYPGKYYAVMSTSGFMFSAGARPFGMHVFFNERMPKSVSRKAFVFSVAHEYHHYKSGQAYVLWAFNVLKVLFGAVIPAFYFLQISPALTSVVWAALASFSAWFMLSALDSLYLRQMEYNADRYAVKSMGATIEDVVELFNYIPSGKKRYFRTHPHKAERLSKLFGISMKQAALLLTSGFK